MTIILFTVVGLLVGVKLAKLACNIAEFVEKCSRPVFMGLNKLEGTYFD